VATNIEISNFFKNAEQKAFKKAFFLVKNEDAALDLVQDSMLKVIEKYQDKPILEITLLFQTILSNSINDWFRQKNSSIVQTVNDLNIIDENQESFLESLEKNDSDTQFNIKYNKEVLKIIHDGLTTLPLRQKEAFLLRYLEEYSITETATIMNCSEGTVKTHCSRACITLEQYLISNGLQK
jgi:RNA polymerase sigma-70 factor (ECF subfamily)